MTVGLTLRATTVMPLVVGDTQSPLSFERGIPHFKPFITHFCLHADLGPFAAATALSLPAYNFISLGTALTLHPIAFKWMAPASPARAHYSE